MDPITDRVRRGRLWALVGKQHGVVSRGQLLELGYDRDAIRHRLRSGRLHRIGSGVYSVGRPEATMRGHWMGAVLACGPAALLSHRSAAALLGIRAEEPGAVEVVVSAQAVRRRDGIRVYRRAPSLADRSAPAAPSRDRGPLRWRFVDDIPVTGPAAVLVDLASCLPTWQLEAAVNEADHLDLVDPEQLREAIETLPRRPGRRRLRELLDGASFALASTRLESLFLPLARAAGLTTPTTQAAPRGHRVDFLWPELGLVVEADSLRYHRTAFKQAKDKRRDNAHTAAGLATLRFTHGQIRFEPAYVRHQLRITAARLKREGKGGL